MPNNFVPSATLRLQEHVNNVKLKLLSNYKDHPKRTLLTIDELQLHKLSSLVQGRLIPLMMEMFADR